MNRMKCRLMIFGMICLFKYSIMEANISVEKEIKHAFLAGRRLTSCSAAREFLTGDLRKYVSNLRKEGVPITDKWETSRNGKRYKVYYCEVEN